MKDIWSVLNLNPATSSELDALDGVSTGDDNQSAPLKISFPDLKSKRDTAVATVSDWHRQEPVERIVNTILLCAIRDGAQIITVEPEPRGIRVRFTLDDTIRDHIQLPIFALEPLVARFKTLAALKLDQSEQQSGAIRLQVDGRDYGVYLSTSPTMWGQRLELRLASG
jgi:type II secretory ATPase GspE/PulE/Tfp pilus assembly ATPase PilB-like protein